MYKNYCNCLVFVVKLSMICFGHMLLKLQKEKKLSRCDALQNIVEEHMRFMAKMEEGRKKIWEKMIGSTQL